MRDEFVDYLGAIGVTTTAIGRVAEVYNFYHSIYPQEIPAVFVTDFINDEGRREYENLWFFTDSLTMEAKNFLTGDDFDAAPLRRNLSYWSIKKQHYDFAEATDKSRLSLYFRSEYAGGGITFDLKASGENCDYLRDIFFRYVSPNLKASESASN